MTEWKASGPPEALRRRYAVDARMVAAVALDDRQVLSVAAAVAEGLCDACLGRCFARLEPGNENSERGERLRRDASIGAPPASCALCEGIVDRVSNYVELAGSAGASYEADSFLVGSRYFPEIVARQQRLWARAVTADEGDLADRLPPPSDGSPPWPAGEWLKNEVNRRVGREVEKRLGIPVDFATPQMRFTIDTRVDLVGVETTSVWIAGRYTKQARDLPQTRWPCRVCRGVGCRGCSGSGKTYDSSVEEVVSGPAIGAYEAESASFHGMGREDIDARMLGTGRPFVLELKRPRRRSADLDALAVAVNRAGAGATAVTALRSADRSTAVAYKEADPPKTYRAACLAAAPVPAGKLLNETLALDGVHLEQRTPRRVAHRRSDKVRRRRVRSVRVLEHDDDRFTLEIEADSGTYIKEFVSGDDGRTRPSMAERLGTDVGVETLDVMDIGWKE